MIRNKITAASAKYQIMKLFRYLLPWNNAFASAINKKIAHKFKFVLPTFPTFSSKISPPQVLQLRKQ